MASDVVNTDLGERWEDFEALLKELREVWEPVGPGEEKEVFEIAKTEWRLKRVSRAENGETTKEMSAHFWGMLWDRKEQFNRDRVEWELMRAARKLAREKSERPVAEQVKEIDEIIRQLKRTIDGIDFVNDIVKTLQKEIEETQTLSSENWMLLIDCFGIEAIDLPANSTDDEILEGNPSEDYESEDEPSNGEKLGKEKLEIVLAYIDLQIFQFGVGKKIHRDGKRA